MELVESQAGETPILHVTGDVDHQQAPALRKSVAAALASGSSCLLLDLEFCPYLDSGGVSVLLEALRKVRSRGWLGLVAPSRDVHRILELVGITIDPHARVFASLGEARAALVSTDTRREDEG